MSLLFLMLALAAPQADADPMAPAKDGKMQCHAPDDAAKTCRSLASYTPLPDGSYRNDATLLISPAGPITLKTTGVVRVKNGAICGRLTDKQVTNAKLFYAGQPMPAAQANALMERIDAAMDPFIGKQICTSYAPGDNGLLTASATIDGVAAPERTQKVRWVSAADGYQVK